jgi:hypothetical protein
MTLPGTLQSPALEGVETHKLIDSLTTIIELFRPDAEERRELIERIENLPY